MTLKRVKQTGRVKQNHLNVWDTDAVVKDAGVSVYNVYTGFATSIRAQNFNVANADYPIHIFLPVGYTAYRINRIIISGATTALNACTCGVFSRPGGFGEMVVFPNTPVTVTTSTKDTNHNMQSLPIHDQDITALVDKVLFFRLQSAAGFAAKADVTVFYSVVSAVPTNDPDYYITEDGSDEYITEDGLEPYLIE